MEGFDLSETDLRGAVFNTANLQNANLSAADLEDAVARFTARTGVRLPASVSHDQLQAVVGGLAPLAWAAGAHERVYLAGLPPHRLDGSWREGYIMIPSTTY